MELHHPVEYQLGLYEALTAAGEDVGLVDFGLRAMDALRLEKAYRAWGADINTEVTPLKAGLERFVAFDKGDFVGREALLRQRRDGVRKRLATLGVDARNTDCWGNEAVWAGDRVVGSRPRAATATGSIGAWRWPTSTRRSRAPARRSPRRSSATPPGRRARRAAVRPGEPPAAQLSLAPHRRVPATVKFVLDMKGTVVLLCESCRRGPRPGA